MSRGTATLEQPKKQASKKEGKPDKVSLQYFLEHYAGREDGYKYEFNNGAIEKTESMNPAQLFIFENLLDFFYTIKNKTGGTFGQELITYTTAKKYRKPDIAYLDKEQIANARKGKRVIPRFMVEIISDTDQINPLNEKIEEYFGAGVKVLWLIYPRFEKVEVYTSPVSVKICKGKTKCSAEKAIPGFVLPAAEVFKIK